jgi:hypothetical protein
VPYTSPLGQALYRQGAPSKVEAEIAGETRTLKIETMRAPTRAEIVRLYPELETEEPQSKAKRKAGGSRGARGA